jgi:hypothetical protein
MTPNNPTGNTIPPNRKPSKHFAITATLNTQKSAFFHESSPTVCPIDFRSTAIDAPETPAPYDAEQLRPGILFFLTASLKTLFL